MYKLSTGDIVVYTESPYHDVKISWEQFRDIIIKAQSRIEKDAPEVMKFLDLIIHGEPQQDYDSMDIYKRLANVSTEPTASNPGSDN